MRKENIIMSKRLIVGVNDLATTHPNIVKEWDYEKNDELKPFDVSFGSEKEAWFLCEKGHSYKMMIATKAHGAGCPYCSNKRVLKGYNDFKTLHPDLAEEWDYDGNSLEPDEVVEKSSKKVHWKCAKGHKWKASPCDRVYKGTGCPICKKEQSTSFPEQAIFYYLKQSFPDALNRERKTIGKELDIYIPSIKTAVEYDGLFWHETEANIKNEKYKNQLCRDKGISLIRVREKGLSFHDDCVCFERTDRYSPSLNKVIEQILEFLDLQNQNVDVDRDSSLIMSNYFFEEKENSLASVFPKVAETWNYEKNGELLPSLISPKSNRDIWWKCDKGHEFRMKVNDRIRLDDCCPICSGKRVLPGFNDLATLEPAFASEWNYEKNGNLKPTDVTKGSNKKVWWKCKNGHEWVESVNNRIYKNFGCPYCSGSRLIKGQNDLLTCFPKIAAEWDYEKNDFGPAKVMKGANKKVWWICPKGHNYKMSIPKRTSRGDNCPICRKEKVIENNPPVVCIETGKIYPNAKTASMDVRGFYDRSYGKINKIVGEANKTYVGYHWRLATEEEKASIGLLETANKEVAFKKIQFDSSRSDAYNKMTIDKVNQVMMSGERMKILVVA